MSRKLENLVTVGDGWNTNALVLWTYLEPQKSVPLTIKIVFLMYISNDIFTTLLHLFLKLSTVTLILPRGFQDLPVKLSMFELTSHALIYMHRSKPN